MKLHFHPFAFSAAALAFNLINPVSAASVNLRGGSHSISNKQEPDNTAILSNTDIHDHRHLTSGNSRLLTLTVGETVVRRTPDSNLLGLWKVESVPDNANNVTIQSGTGDGLYIDWYFDENADPTLEYPYKVRSAFDASWKGKYWLKVDEQADGSFCFKNSYLYLPRNYLKLDTTTGLYTLSNQCNTRFSITHDETYGLDTINVAGTDSFIYKAEGTSTLTMEDGFQISTDTEQVVWTLTSSGSSGYTIQNGFTDGPYLDQYLDGVNGYVVELTDSPQSSGGSGDMDVWLLESQSDGTYCIRNSDYYHIARSYLKFNVNTREFQMSPGSTCQTKFEINDSELIPFPTPEGNTLGYEIGLNYGGYTIKQRGGSFIYNSGIDDSSTIGFASSVSFNTKSEDTEDNRSLLWIFDSVEDRPGEYRIMNGRENGIWLNTFYNDAMGDYGVELTSSLSDGKLDWWVPIPQDDGSYCLKNADDTMSKRYLQIDTNRGIIAMSSTCMTSFSIERNDFSLQQTNRYRSHMVYKIQAVETGLYVSSGGVWLPDIRMYTDVDTFGGGLFELSEGLSYGDYQYITNWREEDQLLSVGDIQNPVTDSVVLSPDKTNTEVFAIEKSEDPNDGDDVYCIRVLNNLYGGGNTDDSPVYLSSRSDTGDQLRVAIGCGTTEKFKFTQRQGVKYDFDVAKARQSGYTIQRACCANGECDSNTQWEERRGYGWLYTFACGDGDYGDNDYAMVRLYKNNDLKEVCPKKVTSHGSDDSCVTNGRLKDFYETSDTMQLRAGGYDDWEREMKLYNCVDNCI